MRKFICKHITKKFGSGFCVFVCIDNWVYTVWLGYGKPLWRKPKIITTRKEDYRLPLYNVGFGWLLLCFQVQIFQV